MKKETVFALVLGITFGIGVAIFFILTAKEKSIGDKKIISAPTITITPVDFKEPPFEITSPANNFVSTSKTITLTGKAAKNALLIISSPTSDKSLKTTSESFEVQFPLSDGENIIKVTSYLDNNVNEKTVKIYYLE
jgi:hypothetical protein